MQYGTQSDLLRRQRGSGHHGLSSISRTNQYVNAGRFPNRSGLTGKSILCLRKQKIQGLPGFFSNLFYSNPDDESYIAQHDTAALLPLSRFQIGLTSCPWGIDAYLCVKPVFDNFPPPAEVGGESSLISLNSHI